MEKKVSISHWLLEALHLGMDLHESGRGQMTVINDVITPVLYEILKK